MPRFVPTPLGDPVAQGLLHSYLDEREAGFRDGGYRRAPADPAGFDPPAGVFLVVYDGDRAVGCGGVRMLSVARGKIKHLWLDPSTRGRGWGRALLGELEGRAAELGATEVVLDTNASLAPAQALYRTSGYAEIEPYNDNPNATHWFRKALRPGDQ